MTNGDTPPGELAIPEHRSDGSIEPTGDMGLVMILVPPGTFVMGAERAPDPDSAIPAQLDASAEPNEGPCHEVSLDAFFISRFEMTQGQWFRLNQGEAPSMYQVGKQYSGIGTVRWTHPVESVSWNDCDRLLRQLRRLT